MNEELCESNPSSGNGAKEKDDAAIAKLALHLQRGVRGPQGEGARRQRAKQQRGRSHLPDRHSASGRAAPRDTRTLRKLAV